MHWRREQFESEEEAAQAMVGNFTPTGHLLLTGRTRFIVRVPDNFIDIRAQYGSLWSRFVSSSGKATLVVLQLPWKGDLRTNFRIVEDLRMQLGALHVLGDSAQCLASSFWELSETGIWLDYMSASQRTLPVAFLVASLLGFLLSWGAFSFVGGVKLLLTAILPTLWVFGLAVWYFQNVDTGAGTGLHWLVPCSTSMLLLALGLDYNVFFYGRALEFRRKGEPDLEAIRLGLTATGPVITSAGLMFAVEFAGLLMSEAPLSRQVGWVMSVGVLMDTFVVRSCVLPALLSVAARQNWAHLPPPQVIDGQDGI